MLIPPDWSFLIAFAQDVRYAWRSIRRAPGLFAAGVLALGLGIGGPTILYGILAGMLSPLPVVDPREVAATTFETLGAYFSDEASVDGEGASPKRYASAYVPSYSFRK